MSDNELESVLLKLRTDYADKLPGTVGQMEDLWRRLVAAETPPSRLAEFARMAHSIAGSGTTFGLPAVSRAARNLELVLDHVTASGQLPGPAEQETVSALLAALRQAAVRA